jgi:hypothetical protein
MRRLSDGMPGQGTMDLTRMIFKRFSGINSSAVDRNLGDEGICRANSWTRVCWRRTFYLLGLLAIGFAVLYSWTGADSALLF